VKSLPLVVSASWLHEHLNDPDLILVDCRFSLQQPTLGRMQYQAGHIPGAYYLDLNQDLSSPVQRHGGRHPLPDPHALSAKLAAMGLSNAERSSPKWLIAYDDSRFAFAARLWWLMNYYSYPQISVLDGGFQGWQNRGYPITAEHPPEQQGTFTPHLQSDWIVDIEQVKQVQVQPDVVLVDSREPSRYRGDEEPIDPIAGHIPGAVNLPWQGVTTPTGEALSAADQRARWQTIPATETIVYCGSGVTACVNLLSRAIANLPPAKLYPGSWSDWCSYL
jgi:thiosulfate/3-mercaptopyruvate sulfurtransferase